MLDKKWGSVNQSMLEAARPRRSPQSHPPPPCTMVEYWALPGDYSYCIYRSNVYPILIFSLSTNCYVGSLSDTTVVTCSDDKVCAILSCFCITLTAYTFTVALYIWYKYSSTNWLLKRSYEGSQSGKLTAAASHNSTYKICSHPASSWT